MIVYIVVLALAAVLFLGLRRMGRAGPAQGTALPAPDGSEGTDLADNLEFAADMSGKAAKRLRPDDRQRPESDDSGGSDGGGGGDGGGG